MINSNEYIIRERIVFSLIITPEIQGFYDITDQFQGVIKIVSNDFERSCFLIENHETDLGEWFFRFIANGSYVEMKRFCDEMMKEIESLTKLRPRTQATLEQRKLLFSHDEFEKRLT